MPRAPKGQPHPGTQQGGRPSDLYADPLVSSLQPEQPANAASCALKLQNSRSPVPTPVPAVSDLLASRGHAGRTASGPT